MSLVVHLFAGLRLLAVALALPSAAWGAEAGMHYSIQLLSSRSAARLEAAAAELGGDLEIRLERRDGWHTLRAGCFLRREDAERALPRFTAIQPGAMLRRASCTPSAAPASPPAGSRSDPGSAASAPPQTHPEPGRPYAAAPWIRADAVPASPAPEFAEALNSIFRELANLVQTPADRSLLKEIFDNTCRSDALPDARRQLLEARRRQLMADRGLSFEAGARVRGPADDYSSNEYSSAYAGIAWDLLRDGRLDNRLQALILERELALHDVQRRSSNMQLQQDCRHSRVIQHFSRSKQQLLQQVENLLGAEKKLVASNYFSGSVPLDDVIRADARLERTRQNLLTATQFASLPGPRSLAVPAWSEPPLVAVAIDRLVNAVRRDPAATTALDLRQQIAELRRDPLADSRLKLYLRPTYSWDTNRQSSSLTAGVLFSTPILVDKSEVWRAEDHLLGAEAEDRLAQTLDGMHRHYAQYRRTLDEGIKLHFLRQEAVERMRRALALNTAGRNDGGNLGALTQAARDLVETQFEVIENKQRLYTDLVQLFAAAAVDYSEDYLLPVAEAPHNRLREGDRGIYVWSAAFNRIDNATLIGIAQSKRLSSLVVSAGARTDADKLESLLDQAPKAGIRVELLGGAPNWALRQRHGEVLKTIEGWFRRADHVHLDIEPHTAADWPTRREEYVAGLASLLEAAAALRTPGKTLSLAVPTNLSSDEIERLAGPVDRLVVMAYETERSDVIFRRLERFAHVPRAKLAVALRPKDYASEEALEARIAELRHKLGIDHFVLHDIEQLADIAR